MHIKRRIIIKNYKSIIISILFSLFSSALFAFNPVEDLKEAGDIYRLNIKLINIEISKDFDEEIFIGYLRKFWNNESLKSIYFKNYLLQSDNKFVKITTLNFIKAEGINDKYSRAIKKKYQMSELYDKSNTGGKKLSYNNKVFDEKINYSLFTSESFYSDTLRVIYPWNSFSQFTISDKKIPNSDVVLMVGGGTNTFLIYIKRFKDENGEKYQKLLKPDNIIKKYSEINQIDVKKYLFDNKNVEGASFIFGSGFDTYFGDSIKNFDCYLIIRSISGITYTVNYFVNMSTINNNWDLYFDLARLFCLYCLMTTVTTK